MDSAQYTLEKWIWTDADFEQMGWDDASVHAVAAIPETFELLFDIDYILRWIDPIPPAIHFAFWVAPATLVFENVWNVEFDLESDSGSFSLLAVQRLDPQLTPNGEMTDWLWTLDGAEGSIRFRATRFQQHFRRQPIHTCVAGLNYTERGGICFDRQSEILRCGSE